MLTRVSPQKVVFKHYFMFQFLIYKLLNEMHLWMRPPLHRHNVLFDRLVIDELDGSVVGSYQSIHPWRFTRREQVPCVQVELA